MRKTPSENYTETEMSIPTWKLQLIEIEKKEKACEESLHSCIRETQNWLTKLEKIRESKRKILAERKERALWG
ncbi:hypothetical protein P3G55_20105 [Leptospira sp. 96542]|nr:hypothetical protein [Leptospira sp. 96542]